MSLFISIRMHIRVCMYICIYMYISYLHIAVYGPWLTKEITYTGIITYDDDDVYFNKVQRKVFQNLFSIWRMHISQIWGISKEITHTGIITYIIKNEYAFYNHYLYKVQKFLLCTFTYTCIHIYVHTRLCIRILIITHKYI
jgi:hypothetical protein